VNLVKALNTPELKSTESCLEHAFLLTDIESKNEELRNSGCTGVVVLILNTDGKRIVYSANAGDSRSLLYTNRKTVRLSVVHTDHSLLPIGPQGCGSRGDEAN